MKKAIIMTLALGLVLAAGLGLGYNYYMTNIDVDTIYEGISINGIELGGLTRDEALAKVKAQDAYADQTINFRYQEDDYYYNYQSLGYDPNYEDLVDQAYAYGRGQDPFERLRDVLALKSKPLNLEAHASFTEEGVESVVSKMADNLYVQPYNAYFAVEEGQIIVINETNGRQIDAQDAKDKIISSPPGEAIELSTTLLEPEIKADELSFNGQDIGTYSTYYGGSIQNRKDNIILSASILDGTIVLPGQQFSFNGTLGPISRSTGFKEATVISDGEFTTGVGGGVCQVSTTLYVAARNAGLQIDERHAHSKPINYVPPGWDAAVAEGLLDLKFTNNTAKPIIIKAQADTANIVFTIVGDIGEN